MKINNSLFTLLFVFIYNLQTFAQCAMCKTTASSDLENGGNIGSGLNSGIYLLMTIPYIILFVGAYFFFKEQVDTKLKEWKGKLFTAKKSQR